MLTNPRRIMLLTSTMAIIALIVVAITIRLLYQTAFNEQRVRLQDYVSAQAILFEILNNNKSVNDLESILAKSPFKTLAVGEIESSLELTLARLVANKIEFLLPRVPSSKKSLDLSFNTSVALPMRMALNGNSGTVIGLDYQGVEVVAAFQFIPSLQLGVVAKIDMQEIRRPYVYVALVALVSTFLLLFIGAGLFRYLGSPLLESILEQESRLKSVLNTTVDAIITIDESGLIESFNSTAEKMFGYKASQVTGKNIRLLMPSDYARAHDGYLTNYITTGKKKIIGIGREVTAKTADGKPFPIDLAISETRFQKRRLFTGIIRDLSKYKEAQAELTKVEDEARLLRERLAHVDRIGTMGELATGIAHEINQPLAAIATYTQACIRFVESGTPLEDITETLDKVSEQAHRAGEVIRRLRNFIKKRESQRAQVNINLLIEEMVLFSQSDARLHNVRLDIQLANDLPLVNVDTVQIQQVILNLVRNGLEAMVNTPKQERLLVIHSQQDSEATLLISVRDQGHGINEKQSHLPFEPFYTTKNTGMGLGLAISRSIIVAHGGELHFCPNQPNGTDFHFSLPIVVNLTTHKDPLS